jgi:hypothetical protein
MVMQDQGSYWTKVLNGRVTRRRAIGAVGAGAAAAAFIAACGGDDDDAPSSSSGGGSGGGATPAGGGSPAASGDPKAGGKLVWQGYGDIGGTVDLIGIIEYGTRQFSGLTHDGLLETKSPPFRASVRLRKSSLPNCIADPWHLTQRDSRTGRTSLSKETVRV